MAREISPGPFDFPEWKLELDTECQRNELRINDIVLGVYEMEACLDERLEAAKLHRDACTAVKAKLGAAGTSVIDVVYTRSAQDIWTYTRHAWDAIDDVRC